LGRKNRGHSPQCQSIRPHVCTEQLGEDEDDAAAPNHECADDLVSKGGKSYVVGQSQLHDHACPKEAQSFRSYGLEIMLRSSIQHG
jgi:hypothetical protein